MKKILILITLLLATSITWGTKPSGAGGWDDSKKEPESKPASPTKSDLSYIKARIEIHKILKEANSVLPKLDKEIVSEYYKGGKKEVVRRGIVTYERVKTKEYYKKLEEYRKWKEETIAKVNAVIDGKEFTWQGKIAAIDKKKKEMTIEFRWKANKKLSMKKGSVKIVFDMSNDTRRFNVSQKVYLRGVSTVHLITLAEAEKRKYKDDHSKGIVVRKLPYKVAYPLVFDKFDMKQMKILTFMDYKNSLKKKK